MKMLETNQAKTFARMLILEDIYLHKPMQFEMGSKRFDYIFIGL
jgi:hypothetical protein